jgi:small redox-active disulfide protein 2
MKVEILGGCCANCGKLEENARKALSELGVKAEFRKVTDYGEIASYGVVALPALVADGEVVAYGRVPSVPELKKMLSR